MISRLKNLLAPPNFSDPEKQRAAYLLNLISLVLLVAAAFGITARLLLMPKALQRALFSSVFILIALLTQYLMRHRRLRLASLLLNAGLWLSLSAALYLFGGVRLPLFGAYTLLIITSALLHSGKAGWIMSALCVLSGLVLVYIQEQAGLSQTLPPSSPTLIWMTNSVFFTIAAILLHLTTQHIKMAFTETQEKEHSLQDSNRALEKLQATLEKRVQERTQTLEAHSAELKARLNQETQTRQQLQAAARQNERRAALLQASIEVSRAIAQIHELTELLPRVTELISQHFGFYHAGIFLIDELRRFALLQAANSPGGQKMLARQHKLGVGSQGIVGYVTSTGKPRIALDVGEDAIHFDNPDLPETRSEMAVPLQIGPEIIGALDVQSTAVSAFSEEDVNALSALADQIAIAIQNARLFQEREAALAEARQTQQRYVQEQWTEFVQQRPSMSYEYRAPNLDAAEAEKQDNGQGSTLNKPIRLRENIIGTLELAPAEEKQTWNEEQEALIEAVVDQLGQALDGARLLENIQQLARREALTRRITDRIRSRTEIERMLQTAIQELGQALHAPRVFVQLDPQRLETEEAKRQEKGSDEDNDYE